MQLKSAGIEIPAQKIGRAYGTLKLLFFRWEWSCHSALLIKGCYAPLGLWLIYRTFFSQAFQPELFISLRWSFREVFLNLNFSFLASVSTLISTSVPGVGRPYGRKPGEAECLKPRQW